MVLPVFHQLDPSQVQNLTGSYGEALSRHERDCDSEKVESWRHVLKEIANLKGWVSSVIKDETRLIKKIVSDIQKKLLHALSPSIDAEGLVGMQSRGTGKVESISLNLSVTTEINLSPAAFKGMYNLRLLKFYYPPFLKLPSKEQMMISEERPFENLKLMNLRSSSKLILIDSDLSKVPNLEVLNLGQCSSCSVGLPSSIKQCTKLTILELYDYKSLCTLSSSIGFLSHLVKLNLSFCRSLTCIPENIGELKSLVELNLNYCSKLASLPSSIGKLKCLVKLKLSGCSELASLPESIGELKSLVELYLFSCSKLPSLPDSIGKLKCLVELYLSSWSKLASLPYSIGELKCLAKVILSSFTELTSLPDCIGEFKSLVSLDISNCSRLVRIPNSIGQLKCLAELNLSGCSKLKSLPNSIYGLESLKWLNLEHCDMLNGFPLLNPRRSEIEEIASTTNKLGCLQFLNLGYCGVLEIPGSIGPWVSLKVLRLPCNDFERIPANIKQLPMLIKLDLHGCERLQHLPQLPSSLQVLIASDCISLTSVEGIFMQGEEDYEAASQGFDFCKCHQLDQNSLTKIIGDARLRILRMTTSLFNQVNSSSLDLDLKKKLMTILCMHLTFMLSSVQQYFGEPIRVRLCIPGFEVPEWFTYKNVGGPSVKIKLPAHWHRSNTTDHLFGFTLCAVVSFGPGQKYRDFDIKCECHLITRDGTQSDLSFHYYEEDEKRGRSSWKREHVFIWSIHSHGFFKEASFHFKPLGGITADAVVQSGVHPLFVQDCIDEPEQPHTEIDWKCLTNSALPSI
ncbi:hypothetical protein SADUNF_Sadunf05G0018100 [Salix dunnii]|uniref:Uncharacterized protein n=1 Tax=Salix dunnii TaxID=1413687 RepID=A0A835K3A3_9ROSI|nr:hypothetical protein SADUNF_Sadunf05G0018100 [Salix dunnii]